MTRRNRGFGLRAVVVESLGAVLLLYLVFPTAVPPEASSQADIDAARVASPRPLPTLHLPAPPTEASLTPMATESGEAVRQVEAERREFVVHELDYSRAALVTMLQQHLQQLAEPFGGGE